MFCPKCGAQVTPGNEYCDKCGAPLSNELHLEGKKKKSSPLLVVVVAVEILVIAVVGGVLFFHFSRENSEKTAESEIVQEDTASDKKEETAPLEKQKKEEASPVSIAPTEPAENSVTTKTPEPEAPPSPEAVVITEKKKVDDIRAGCQRLTTDKVTEASASSTIQQDKVTNPPINILDDDSMSNWQEGVEGEGIGENTYFKFDREYPMEALTLRLGNWKTERYFYGNNRPKTLKIEAGGQTFMTSFPDKWEEFAVQFTSPIQTDDLKITIEEVYKGGEWDDTVITDICFWYR